MRQRKHRFEDDTEINITPMLDIVFIMLIFFIVTTSFIKEEGLEVSRTSAGPGQENNQDNEPIVVRIDETSSIFVQGRVLEARAVEANLEREKAGKPDVPLIVAAHPMADTETLVTVLDAAQAAGIESISVTTTAQ